MFKPQLVAVYGSLREGLGNHRVIAGNEFVVQTTLSGNYRMVSLGGFPGVMPTENPTAPIVVEVYRVESPDRMQSLDWLEGYRGPGENNFYDRQTVKLDNGMEAMIYLLDEKEYGNHTPVEDGDWKEFLNGK